MADGPISDVRRAHADSYVTLEAAAGDPGSMLERSGLVADVRREGPRRFAVHLRDGADPNALLTGLIDAGVALRRFEVVEPTLEQVFIETVGEPEAGEKEALEVSRA